MRVRVLAAVSEAVGAEAAAAAPAGEGEAAFKVQKDLPAPGTGATEKSRAQSQAARAQRNEDPKTIHKRKHKLYDYTIRKKIGCKHTLFAVKFYRKAFPRNLSPE